MDDGEGRGAAALQDREHHRVLPVAPDQVGLRREAIVYVRDVAHLDERAVRGLDRKLVEIGEHRGAAVQRHVVLAHAHLYRARRQDHVLIEHRVHDVLR